MEHGVHEQVHIADAELIAINRGLDQFYITESMTITSQDTSEGYKFKGKSPATVVMTIDAGANVQNCEFLGLTVQGTLDGNNILRECITLNIDFVAGFLQECALSGTITLADSSQCNIWNCNSNLPGSGPTDIAVIDCGGGSGGTNLVVRKYNGGIKLINNSLGAFKASLDVESGRTVIDSTVTAGAITVRGDGSLDDSSAGATVIDATTVTSIWSDSDALTLPKFIALK